ncbi:MULTISPECIES: hypothetical protein [unclassified Streptomyces]|uniref:hypothetical protein n=1 Tax=unclassified Streptomyces TaxID=2593676 RepID=UPI0006AFEFFE|nr:MULTISPECIES: hypothetical protein [unclassified Streptomyces]KOU87074.1 hypothetical protein ADK93_17785 [Streptomyces sp. XY58]KOV05851.1 hypothetical protein ADK89_17695 [Streptomyces sp. XY37]KOV41363.1 hypothetical protein ADK99_32605 [Streptomyces sp. MMG1064]
MTTLLLDGGPVAPHAPVSRTGGVPLGPAGTLWPVCRACAGPLQFLAQIVLDAGVLALFMCAHRPGRCEQWSPSAGGNLALLLPAGGLVPVPVPRGADPQVLGLGAVRAAVPAADLSSAGAPEGRAVLGSLGGEPDWLQYDETPDCPACARPMGFAVGLREGPDPVTAMNFGSGRAYAHVCGGCGAATLLWQC